MNNLKLIYSTLLITSAISPLALTSHFGIHPIFNLIVTSPVPIIYIIVIIFLYLARESTFMGFLFLAPLFISIYNLILCVINLSYAQGYGIVIAPLVFYALLQVSILILTGYQMNMNPNKPKSP